MNPASTNTILLVDDDPMTTELFAEILADTFAVRIANSIPEAQRLLAAESISAIISDYHLANQSADDLLDWLIEHQPSQLSNFILLTGDKVSNLRRFEQQTTVLYKPVPITTLLATLQDMLLPEHSL